MEKGSFGVTESELGIGNKLELLDDEILENLKDIQLKNGLRPSESLTSGDFTVEMETGTGKTYVYLRTIFELNKRYGFTKFVIVVPSVAIKEGTYKTLQITREHFENLYPMAKGYEYFQYDSGKPGTVRNFATTVIATESYEQFAEKLQKEIEDDTGIRFGVVEPHQFADLEVTAEDGTTSRLGVDKSEKVWTYLKDNGFVDAKGKVQDTLRTALKDNTLTLPKDVSEQEDGIKEILRKLAGKLDIKNADERITIRTREAVLESEGFKALWDRIKHKTTYRVEFDNAKLIDDCARAITDGPSITKTRAQFRVADIAIGKSGVQASETSASGFTSITESDIALPDLLTDLQDKTQLTRKSLVKILTDSRRLPDFKKNPQEFIDLASEAINRTKRLALVDGIKYQRVGDDHYYAQKLFEQEELTGYLKNTLQTQKSIYEHVVYDSAGVERRFAEELEANEAVKVYAKLPGWFKVPTPLGTYNPDWAVLIEDDGQEKLYFVVETKGSGWWDDLRHKEGAKIACGKEHFAVLAQGDNPAKYIHATSVGDMMKHS
jgi:type III restriction enzyme